MEEFRRTLYILCQKDRYDKIYKKKNVLSAYYLVFVGKLQHCWIGSLSHRLPSCLDLGNQCGILVYIYTFIYWPMFESVTYGGATV